MGATSSSSASKAGALIAHFLTHQRLCGMDSLRNKGPRQQQHFLAKIKPQPMRTPLHIRLIRSPGISLSGLLPSPTPSATPTPATNPFSSSFILCSALFFMGFLWSHNQQFVCGEFYNKIKNETRNRCPSNANSTSFLLVFFSFFSLIVFFFCFLFVALVELDCVLCGGGCCQ